MIRDMDTIANNRMLDDHELTKRENAQLDLWKWLKRKETY